MLGTRMIGALAALSLLLAGCFGDDDGGATTAPGATGSGPQTRDLPDIELAAALRPIGSCDELRTWAREELAPRIGATGFPGAYYYGGGFAVAEDMAVSDGDASGVARDEAAPNVASTVPAPGFSGTNNQVEGVDEPDVVKTDGTRIVTATNDKLFLVDGASQRILDSVELSADGLYGGQLLLAGDRVLVIGSAGFPAIPVDDTPAQREIQNPTFSGTTVTQFDINGDQLEQSDQFDLEGELVSARMIGDVVRLVVHANPEQRLPLVTPATPTEDAINRATEVNKEVVNAAAGEDFLPLYRQLDADGNTISEGTQLDCDDAHAPNTFSGFGMVSVLSVDLSDGLKAGIEGRTGAGVLAGGQTVYASPDHLYVAAPEWQDWPEMSEEEIRAASEKHGTDIHRFDISDPKQATYEASGRVDGDLLDQFAMDEKDDALRVATTLGSQWASEGDTSQSQVVVLGPKDGSLQQVGKVDGLGKGESIQSVRFDGDTAYVVTFRQTDPLYTIDLSDPAAPRVAGELKILGYSAYLHPIGDGKLIGVGQDATEEGRTTGTQVALFDVSDPAAPARIAQAVLPNASSEAEWDHHAFLWWAETGLVAIPVNSYNEGSDFQGLVGFHADVPGAAISEVGRIEHPAQASQVIDGCTPEECGKAEPAPPTDVIAPTPTAYKEPITRSLVIGDKLWTLSQSSLGVSDLATLGQTSIIPLS